MWIICFKDSPDTVTTYSRQLNSCSEVKHKQRQKSLTIIIPCIQQEQVEIGNKTHLHFSNNKSISSRWACGFNYVNRPSMKLPMNSGVWPVYHMPYYRSALYNMPLS